MVKAIPLLCFIVCIQITRAQVPIDWHRTYGIADRHDYLHDFAIDTAGNTFLVGRMEWTGIVTKTDRFGTLLWSRGYPSSANPNLHVAGLSVATDRLGNVYTLYSEARADERYLVDRRHIVKYDPSGTELWDRLLLPPSDTKWGGWGGVGGVFKRLSVDSSNALYSAHNAGKPDNQGNVLALQKITMNNTGWESEYGRDWGRGYYGWDMRLDGQGNVYMFGVGQWTTADIAYYGVMKVLPSSVMDWFYSLPMTVSGEVGGIFAVDATGNTFVGLNQGLDHEHWLLVKLNSDKQLQWTVSGAGGYIFRSLVPDHAGGVYVIGGSQATTPYSIAKYNSAGSRVWTNSYRDDWDLGTTDSTGSLYVANKELTVAKFDSAGGLVWALPYPTPVWHDVKGLAVDDSGYVYVGSEGSDWHVMRIAPFYVYRPAPFEKWISGQVDTIRWHAPGWHSKNVKVILNEGTAVEQEIPIATGITAGSSFVWDIPDGLLSYRTRIVVENAADSSQKIRSGLFRLKPYVLTKFNSDSTYRPYLMELDAWGFANTRVDMWPESFWRPRIDYQGIDPFTNVQYSQTQADSAFAVAEPDSFPNWESFVNAFGINACYLDVENAVYNPVAVLIWARILRTWRGSCFGIATSNAMVFLDRERFVSLYPSLPLYAEPITVASDNFVIRTVTELHTHQFGNPTRDRRLFGQSMSPNQTLEELKALLSEDVATMRTLSFYNSRGPGGHTVLGYRMEREAPPSSNYRVFVYDSNFQGNSSASILIDTLALFGIGRWTTVFGYPGWGGYSGLFLEVPAENNFFDAGLPKRGNLSPQTASDFAVPDSLLEVLVAAGADVVITDAGGNLTGLVDGAVKTEIPGSNALCSFDGQETPPYGYLLKNNAYHLRLDSAQSGRTGLTLRNGTRLFSYDRNDAAPDETDFISYDGSMKMANPDPVVKRARFLCVESLSSGARLFALRGVNLDHMDSVSVESAGRGGGSLRFRSYGGARTYDLEVNHAAPGGLGRFVASGISLGANTAHTIVPDWTDLDQFPVTILIDESNDGSIDDTIKITNAASGVGRGDRHGVPDEFTLFQNYPNPFNPSTTIKYELPTQSHVTLAVYNMLGQEVAVLVDELQTAGYKSVEFNGSSLPSGVYLYRLTAGEFVAARKFVLLK